MAESFSTQEKGMQRRFAMFRWVMVIAVTVSLTVLPFGCGGSEQAGPASGMNAKQGTLQGTVLDADGEPIAGARINISGKTTGGDVQSNVDGVFGWGGPEGTYEITATVDGDVVAKKTVELKGKVQGIELKGK